MKRLTAMLSAAILPFCLIGASYTNSFVRNGATYVQRGGLTIKDFVVTNITSSGDSITTNDVLSLISSSTNSLVGALTDEDNPLIVQKSRTSYGLGTEGGTPARRSTQDIFSKLDSATTTNDVCNIVTNTITGFTDWTFSPPTNATEEIARYLFDYEGGNQWLLSAFNDNGEAVFSLFAEGGPDATSLSFGSSYTATRSYIPPRNALGLARLDDLPPLTNNIPEMISAAAPDYANVSNRAMSALSQSAPSGSGKIQWLAYLDDYALSVFGNTLRIADGQILASSGVISFSGADEGFTWNGSPVATVADVSAASQANTNYTDSAISSADTTYTRFAIAAPTNINQSVQYINITAETPTALDILLPTGNGTKDWLIYVQSVTNVSINLPAATWWMADVAYTNDIAPATPTALYFSQIDTGLYLFSRQDLAPVTISTP